MIIYIYTEIYIYIYIDITYIVFTHRFLTVFPEKRMLRAYHIVVSVILSGRPWGPKIQWNFMVLIKNQSTTMGIWDLPPGNLT